MTLQCNVKKFQKVFDKYQINAKEREDFKHSKTLKFTVHRSSKQILNTAS